MSLFDLSELIDALNDVRESVENRARKIAEKKEALAQKRRELELQRARVLEMAKAGICRKTRAMTRNIGIQNANAMNTNNSNKTGSDILANLNQTTNELTNIYNLEAQLLSIENMFNCVSLQQNGGRTARKSRSTKATKK
jgi:hypothetical protein